MACCMQRSEELPCGGTCRLCLLSTERCVPATERDRSVEHRRGGSQLSVSDSKAPRLTSSTQMYTPEMHYQNSEGIICQAVLHVRSVGPGRMQSQTHKYALNTSLQWTASPWLFSYYSLPGSPPRRSRAPVRNTCCDYTQRMNTAKRPLKSTQA